MAFLFILLFVAAVWGVIERSATCVTYNVPFTRLFNTRWGITETENLIYVFRGQAPWEFWMTPMEAVFWLGSRKETSMEAAKLIAAWANENKISRLPDVSEVIRDGFYPNYATPEQALEDVKACFEGRKRITKRSRVLEV